MSSESIDADTFGRPFTVRQGRDRGARRRDLYGAGVSRPHHGVRAGLNPDWRTSVRALMEVVPDDAVLSHGSAAAWLGLPVPDRVLRDIHVTLPGSGRRIRRPGVVGHSGARASARVDGITVAHPAEILADLAGTLTHLELVCLADGALTRWPKIDLKGALDGRKNVRGWKRLMKALGDARPGSKSPKETECRLVFMSWGLPEPEMNGDIVVNGEWLATADLLFKAQRLAVEYYGEQHSDSMSSDVARVHLLERVDYSVEIVVASDLRPGRIVELKRRITPYFW